MIVGVMATSEEETTNKYSSLAKAVGAVVAAEHFHLLTGGGLGLMQIAGEAFRKTRNRKGQLISILRAKDTDHLTGPWDTKGNLKLNELEGEVSDKKIQPTKKRSGKKDRHWEDREDNKLAEIVIRTHLPYSGRLGEHDLSRNHINVLTSDLIVILPGGTGTLSELRLAHEYDRPIAVFLGDGGTVGGKSAAKIKSEFVGVTIASTADQLKHWMVSTRANLAAGKRHNRGRFV